MNTLHLDLPDWLLARVRERAAREGLAVDRLVANILAAELAATDYLEERGRRGNRAKYEAALARVPDEEPEARDARPAPR